MTNLGWTVISDVAPKEFIGLTAGIFNFSANLAGIVTPLVIGYTYQSTGSFVGPLVYIGVVALVGAFSYSVILGDIHRLTVRPIMNPDLRIPNRELHRVAVRRARSGPGAKPCRCRSGRPAGDPGVAEPGEAALLAREDVRRIARPRDRHARRLQHDVAGAGAARRRDGHSLELDQKHADVREKECRPRGRGRPRHHSTSGPPNRPCSG